MRYKAVFIAGAAVGFVAGTRAGREVYDKMLGYGKQVIEHPKVQQASNTAQSKATEFAKTAKAKGPGYAKNAASSARKTAQTQVSAVPGYVSNVRQATTSRMPFGGKTSKGDKTTTTTTITEVTEVTEDADPSMSGDVAPDGSVLYPVDDPAQTESMSGNSIRYTPNKK
jgi:hypothetical protein